MADVSKRLCKGNLTGGGGLVYTVPPNKNTFVKAVTLCNAGGRDLCLLLKFDDVYLIYNHIIKANDTLTVPFLDQIIESGEKISITIVNATGSTGEIKCSYYISGREVDV